MPNWVSNLMILRPEDCKKVQEYMTLDDGQDDEDNLRLDFEKIIPMPETVYRGNSGFGDSWHPKDLTMEEYKEKYPDGDWYKWSINNWGTKWNACNTSFCPPEGDEPYGVLTFDTAWSLPVPVLDQLYEGKGVNYQLFFVEESHAFFGAIPFTLDETYPEYTNDPYGSADPDKIFEMVTGSSEFDWLEDDYFETLSFVVDELKCRLREIERLERPAPNPDGSQMVFLQIKEGYIEDLLGLAREVVQWKSTSKDTFAQTVRNFRDYVFPEGDYYEWSGNVITNGLVGDFIARTNIRTEIQKVRMLGLNHGVGLNEKRCNERLYEILRYEQLQMLSPEYTPPETLTIDSTNGKRLLFKYLLRGASYDGLQAKIENLIRQGVQDTNNYGMTPPEERNKTHFGIYSDNNHTVNSLLDTARALVELYDEIPTMGTTEFLRLMDVYIRTNLFHLDDENVTNISQEQLTALREIRRRIGTIHFKCMVQTGFVDSTFLSPGAAYIKTEKLGL